MTDKENQGIPGALVVLTDQDHHTIFSANTDSLGVFVMPMPENFSDKILFVSCFEYKSMRMENPSVDKIAEIILEPLNIELEGVEISTSKPVIIRQIDRFVVPNVSESAVAKGKDIAEFLKYTPLIGNVTENNEVSILGNRGNATIYVNGRESSIDLKSIPAESIDRIEIISNPGSKYPADSKSGIINIVMRKQAHEGTMVHINLDDRQNRKNSPSARVFLDLQKGKTNITTGINASSYNLTMEDRSIYNYFSDSLTTHLERDMDISNNRASAFVNLDYAFSKKQTLGFRLDGNIRDSKEKNTTTTDYLRMYSLSVDSSDITHAETKMPHHAYNLHGNVNYNLNIKEGQKLAMDFDYRRSQMEMKTQYDYSNDSMMMTPPQDFMTYPAIIVDGYAFKTDFSHEFDADKTLNAGMLLNGALVDNDYFYGIFNGSEYISDSLQTNRFLYKDITAALYIDYQWIISDNWELEAGLRGEFYAYNGLQKVTDEKINDSYLNLFPSLSVYFIPNNDDHEIGFDFSSSIFRPGYSQLNPFKTFYSPHLYQENNPYLQPSKDYEFELSYSWQSKYMIFASYCYSKDSWTEFTTPAGNGVTKMVTENFGSEHYFDITASINQGFFKNYLNISLDANVSYQTASGLPDDVIIDNQEGTNYSATAKMSLMLNKKKDFMLRSRFDYHSTSKSLALTIQPLYYWEMSLSKSFKNSTLSLGVNDITYQPIKISLTDPTYSYSTSWNRFSRTFWISYSIKFGNKKVKSVQGRGEQELNRRMDL